MSAQFSNIHATAIVLGTGGFLIVGPSGSGKSSLALACLSEVRKRGSFAALVADDRVNLSAENGRVIARCPPAIQGLVEIRGSGIVQVETVAACVLDWAILPIRMPYDPRLPPENEQLTLEIGETLPLLRLPVDSVLPPVDALRTLLRLKLGF